MIALNDITSFDMIVVLIFALFVIRGIWIGFMRQFTVFAALIGSYLLAGRYAVAVMPYVGQVFDSPKAVFFISFALLFVFGALFLFLAGKMLHLVMEITLTGWFDRFLGFILGLSKAILAASFLYMVLSSSFISANELLARSVTAGFLADGAAIVRQAIHDLELREMFIPKEPAIKPEQEELPAEQPADEVPGQPAAGREIYPPESGSGRPFSEDPFRSGDDL